MPASRLILVIALPSLLALAREARGAFIRSEFNADGKVDIADPVGILGHLFQGAGNPGCLDAGDANDDGTLDITDAVFTLSFLFLGGTPPPAPYPACGDDPTADALGCETPQDCGPIACGDPTLAATEGPYYKSGSPERASLLEEGLPGTRMVLSGRVLSPDCEPVANSWLDFWHADDAGDYDNAGYRLRGHLFTDAAGRYALETIVPGIYPGRTRHLHVKARAPDGPILTTQLFFPGEPMNATDGIFREELLISVEETGETLEAAFDFVVERA